MKKYKIDQIFPTCVIQLDYSDTLTKEDQEIMIRDIDQLIKDNNYYDTSYHPKYQTNTNLFDINNKDVWIKLRSTFIESCHYYIQNVPNLIYNQEALQPYYTNAWACKNWKSLNEVTIPPWHNHNPAFLTGVFYLKIPGDKNYGGTEFGDPRFPQCNSNTNYMSIPTEFTWSIFPGWIHHRSVYIDSEEPRYVISANIYCAPNYD